MGDTVCAGTGFCAAECLADGNAHSAFDFYLAAWCFRCNDPAMYCYVDAGTEVSSEYFITAMASVGTTVRVAAIDSHRTVGVVENHHRSLRSGMYRVVSEHPEADFAFVVLAVNATLNRYQKRGGEVQSVLFFGSQTTIYLAGEHPKFPGQLERMKLLSAALESAWVDIGHSRLQAVRHNRAPSSPRSYHELRLATLFMCGP